MKPIYFHAYLKSYSTSHLPLEMSKAVGNNMCRGISPSILHLTCCMRDLVGFHHELGFLRWDGHILSGHIPYFLSGKSQWWSMSRREESRLWGIRSQLPQLIFVLFGICSLKRKIVDRIYTSLNVFSNHWIFPFPDSTIEESFIT